MPIPDVSLPQSGSVKYGGILAPVFFAPVRLLRPHLIAITPPPISHPCFLVLGDDGGRCVTGRNGLARTSLGSESTFRIFGSFWIFFFCSFNFWNQSGWGQAFKFQPGGPWGSPKLDKGCWLEKAASWTASRSLPFFFNHLCASKRKLRSETGRFNGGVGHQPFSSQPKCSCLSAGPPVAGGGGRQATPWS